MYSFFMFLVFRVWGFGWNPRETFFDAATGSDVEWYGDVDSILILRTAL
jgi:hypothetical protein